MSREEVLQLIKEEVRVFIDSDGRNIKVSLQVEGDIVWTDTVGLEN
jgi:hypothetical protein